MELSLKEKRNYITGADIINFAFDKIIDKKKIVFNFYKFSKNQLEIKTSKVKKKSLVATINYLRKKNKIFIVEKKKLIKKRTSFNEDKLIKNYLIKKKTIILRENNFNFFDTIVALNKKLLNHKIVKNNWIFCKLEIEQVKNLKYSELRIQLKDSIRRKFYRSSIYLDKKLLGFIHFVKQ
tara:strand:+ start:23884 stop:24423 length:540 start_codon:yes stop_codon:yes gene_type:complete